MFEAADNNKDSKLDRAEFLVFQFPEENPAMHPHILAQTLEERDKDADGFINFEEFLDRKGNFNKSASLKFFHPCILFVTFVVFFPHFRG